MKGEQERGGLNKLWVHEKMILALRSAAGAYSPEYKFGDIV